MLSDHLDSTVSCQYSHNYPFMVCHYCILMLSDHLDSTVSCQYSQNCPVILCLLLNSDVVRSIRQHSELSIFTQMLHYTLPVAVFWWCEFTYTAQWAVIIHTIALLWCANCRILMLSFHLDSTVSCHYSHNCPVIVCQLFHSDAVLTQSRRHFATCRYPLPKRDLPSVWASASSFNFPYLLFS